MKVTQSYLTLCNPMDDKSMEFSRAEYWSGYPFPSPGDLPSPDQEPRSPILQAYSLPSEPPGKPTLSYLVYGILLQHPKWIKTCIKNEKQKDLLPLEETLFLITALCNLGVRIKCGTFQNLHARAPTLMFLIEQKAEWSPGRQILKQIFILNIHSHSPLN